MHPPYLKLVETNKGSPSCGACSVANGKEIGNNNIEGTASNMIVCVIFSTKLMFTCSSSVGLSNSYIVIMVGRWIMYDTGAWDFKIYNDRMGRTVD